MPQSCAVPGCKSKFVGKQAGGIRKSFYRIPAVQSGLYYGEATRILTERRRAEWITAIGIKEPNVTTQLRVCSDHFISGKPAYLHYETDPDWVPSLHLNCEEVRGIGSRTEQHMGAKKRKRRNKDHDAVAALRSLVKCEEVVHPEPMHADAFVDQDCQEHKPILDKMCQTELTMIDINNLENSFKDKTVQTVALKQSLSIRVFDESKFQNNDDNVKYYTGLSSWLVLLNLMNFIMPYMSHNENSVLSKFQDILIVLMKLRLGCTNKLLGDIFGISKRTVSAIFLRTLNIMYHNLNFLIHWPTKECLRKTMPLDFVLQFGTRVAFIIDCFQIFIERPSNLRARAQTYSNYKSNYTIKYLMGITPQGCICYISDGWGGRASDKHILENSNFLNKLDAGDIVLADKGFDINDSVNLMCAEIKIPAFTQGKKQLYAYDNESTRNLAHLRIHVERVIGNMHAKYTILSSVIPIDFLLTDDNTMTTLDQVVLVCASLTNLCPSGVPFV